MINISELIGDPDFTQPNGVTVKRTSYSIVNHKVVPNTPRTLKLTGIITIANDRTTDMQPESDRNAEAINVFTYKPLYTTGIPDASSVSTFLSDVIIWQGLEYAVMNCMDDAQYGFCKSVCHKLKQEVM